ncbi:MAG: enoyl-CoA hydratase/isomerase family protein [Chloroflexi bacterium]|nr:enoyl-CoA hydratase/isomerase family protein [Chloroflexota bacterium]
MSTFETIKYEKDGGIASITLNRPGVLNAYNMQMRDEMYQVLEAVQDDPEVAGVLLSGAGERAFCAGADLTEFGTAPSQVIARQVRWERDVWGLMASIPQPMVAALHGYVLGSGVEIAALCDLRVAAEDAVFGLPEVTLGMVPAAGGSQTLPRLVGRGVALEMLLTSRRLDAREALRVCLVHRVVPRERLMEEALGLLHRVLSHPPAAVRAIKEAVRRGADMPLAEALDLEWRLAMALASGRGIVKS